MATSLLTWTVRRNFDGRNNTAYEGRNPADPTDRYRQVGYEIYPRLRNDKLMFDSLTYSFPTLADAQDACERLEAARVGAVDRMDRSVVSD